MKTIRWEWLISIIAILACSCVIDDNSSSSTSSPTSTPSKKIHIVFDIRADFPEGALQPDRVAMDGTTIQETMDCMTGSHEFVIEKQGYNTKTISMIVQDDNQDGVYRLATVLEAKKRVVRFNITDKVTGKILEPDQVMISSESDVTTAGSKSGSVILTDTSLVKPGLKKLVIQKNGYRNISVDITIFPDEEPYILTYQMEPIS